MNFNSLLRSHTLFGRINNQIMHEQTLKMRQAYIDRATKAIEDDNMPRFKYENYWIVRTEQMAQYA